MSVQLTDLAWRLQPQNPTSRRQAAINQDLSPFLQRTAAFLNAILCKTHYIVMSEHEYFFTLELENTDDHVSGGDCYETFSEEVGLGTR